MYIIDAFTVVVDNAAELQTVVGTGNTYNYVYLSTDIFIDRAITIDPAKAALTIDGEYPEGSIHTLSDRDSNSEFDTFGIKASSSIQLTVKNMVIHGYNYFGLPYITSGLFIDNSNTSLTYDNVTYVGPQICYNPDGLVRFNNCDITIRGVGVSESQEVAEANRVVLGGNVRVMHESTNAERAVFWFRGNTATTSFTVEPGAMVDITSVNNYFMYSLNTLGVATYPVYTIGMSARFTLRANRGISYNSSHRAASLTVAGGAIFDYVQSAANGTNASFYINSALTVGTGANLYMQASYAGAQPLLSFPVTGAQINVNSASSFVLYNSVNNVFAFTGTENFYLAGNQVNYWNPSTALASGAGSFTDTPTRKWMRQDTDTFYIRATATSTATTVTESSSTADELGTAFNLLTLQNAHVLSVGDLRVTATVRDNGGPITGQTQPGALVRVRFTVAGTAYELNGTADTAGAFALPTGDPAVVIPAGTDVSISVNTPFLITTITATSQQAGELALVSVPEHIRYATPVITAGGGSYFTRYFPQDDEPVIVEDSRAESSTWVLAVSITGDPRTAGGQTLPNSLVFRDSLGALHTLNGTPYVVYTGGPNGGVTTTTTIIWPPDEGIMLIATEPIVPRVEYITSVNWTLTATGDGLGTGLGSGHGA